MSTTAIADRPLSYEEERGKPLPSRNHSVVQTNLGCEFKRSAQFRILSELDLDLRGHHLTPDLCVYPAGPIDFSRDILRRTDPPLLVAEILTLGQLIEDGMDKISRYLESGVKSCWMVIPPTQSITVFSPDGAQKTFTEGTVTDPAIGLSAELAAVFS